MKKMDEMELHIQFLAMRLARLLNTPVEEIFRLPE